MWEWVRIDCVNLSGGDGSGGGGGAFFIYHILVKGKRRWVTAIKKKVIMIDQGSSI